MAGLLVIEGLDENPQGLRWDWGVAWMMTVKDSSAKFLYLLLIHSHRQLNHGGAKAYSLGGVPHPPSTGKYIDPVGPIATPACRVPPLGAD